MTAEQDIAAAIIPRFSPPWAEVFGEDDFGIFAEFLQNGARFVWRWIEPGRFVMGSPGTEPVRDETESPPHVVTLTRGFWLGETPVTQAQWQALMGGNPSNFQGMDRPVEQVNWNECVDFGARLSAMVPGLFAVLPTEAQWEYACRAGTTGSFQDGSPCTLPEGKDSALDLLGWFVGNSGRRTHEVKQKKPNEWGLYDLHGNVWEWCQDAWYNYDSKEEENPVHLFEVTSADRVARGGSWGFQARFCRAAYRFRIKPGHRWHYLGFRLAAGQEPSTAEPSGEGRLSGPERRSRG